MKAVILAGGLGTRLLEETTSIPKPMVKVGGKPILWHILKIFQTYNINEFIICAGYKSELIKEYFLNYHILNSDFEINLKNNDINILKKSEDNFKVSIIDTGLYTNTAGRIKKIKKYIQPNESFLLTYGDGVANININELIEFHKKNDKIATLTAVKNTGRFGTLNIEPSTNIINDFKEKIVEKDDWINGGFFVLNYDVFKYLDGDMDDIQWEKGPLINITNDNELMAYKHYGFWKAMDALRDKKELDELWANNLAEWKIWN